MSDYLKKKYEEPKQRDALPEDKNIRVGKAVLCFDAYTNAWIKPHTKNATKFETLIFDRGAAHRYCQKMSLLMASL